MNHAAIEPVRPRALIVGRVRAEMSLALAGMREHSDVVCVDDVAAGVCWLADVKAGPELMVVAQGWPGEVRSESIEQLAAAAPLAPIWLLLGSLCEGEVRTGQPCPGAPRVYWHQWPARAARAAEQFVLESASAWSLPTTSREDERVAEAAARIIHRDAADEKLVAIGPTDCYTAELLKDLLRRRGYEVLKVTVDDSDQPSCPRPPVAVVWSTSAAAVTSATQVADLKAACHDAPLVAIVDFPRHQHVAAAHRAGVEVVLSRPFHVVDLYWHLDQLAQTAALSRS